MECFVDVSNGEFLHPEPKGEKFTGQKGHHFLADDGFSAAGWPRYQDDLLRLDGSKHFLDDARASQMEGSSDRAADLPEHKVSVVLQCREYELFVRTNLAVCVDKSGWKVGALQAPRRRTGLAREGQKGVPGSIRARDRIRIGRLEGKQRLDVRLGLVGGGVQIEAHDVQHAQERPQVFGGDGRPFEFGDNLAKFVALMDGLLRDKTVKAQPSFELIAFSCASSTVEKPDEILEECVRAA